LAQYILKRLLLFIPTLVLVSILAFWLNSAVSADRAQTILSVQGYEDTRPGYEEAYDKVYIDNNLHLPVFYFSISNNGTTWLDDQSINRKEKALARQWIDQKYTQVAIRNVLAALKPIEQKAKTYLLDATSPKDLLERLSSPTVSGLSSSEIGSIEAIAKGTIDQKVTWHYPVLRWNGMSNQYHHWIWGILTGDFGTSLKDRQPVWKKIAPAISWTLIFALICLPLSVLLSLLIGGFLGTRAGSRSDHWISSILFGLYSIPRFWMATMLIVFFTTAEYGGWTDVFPSVGIWSAQSGDSVFGILWRSRAQLILPILVMVIPDIAYLVRVIRGTIVEEYNKEYIKTAKSKGVSSRQIMRSHLIPNSLIPTITILSNVIPSIFSSAVIIEVIFNMPGIGRLLLDSIRSADWAVVFPILLIVSLVTLVSYLIADVLMAWVNPKIKLT